MELAFIFWITSLLFNLIKISFISKVVDLTWCCSNVLIGLMAFHPSIVLNGCSAVTKGSLLFIEYTLYLWTLSPILPLNAHQSYVWITNLDFYLMHCLLHT